MIFHWLLVLMFVNKTHLSFTDLTISNLLINPLHFLGRSSKDTKNIFYPKQVFLIYYSNIVNLVVSVMSMPIIVVAEWCISLHFNLLF